MKNEKIGRVGYIPKLTGNQLAKQKKEPEDWIIEFDDGTVAAWLYCPSELQPCKRIVFIKRGTDNYIGMTSKELDRRENEY